MSGKVWVQAALVAVVGVAVAVGVMVVLLVGAWWSLGSEDYYSEPGPEVVRHTPQQFQELSERTVQDTLGSLGLVLSDRGCTVDRYEQRSDGTPSKLAVFDRRFTAGIPAEARERFPRPWPSWSSTRTLPSVRQTQHSGESSNTSSACSATSAASIATDGTAGAEPCIG
ncbi:hypothetical protein WN990_35125 [Kitasatospora purpeofusca]|uniref:hypothetical protein n=1 Tax=Kitasatospora purpeofusca TaxID=67352 RepID=UPI0030F026B4